MVLRLADATLDVVLLTMVVTILMPMMMVMAMLLLLMMFYVNFERVSVAAVVALVTSEGARYPHCNHYHFTFFVLCHYRLILRCSCVS